MVHRVRNVRAEALHDMSTKQLFGLLRRLLACEESLVGSDIQDAEEREAELAAPTIRFKDDPRWRPLYDAVKSELATREHLPTGDERTQTRAQRVKVVERRTHGRRPKR